MLCLFIYSTVVAQVDIMALSAILLAAGGFVLNLVSTKQSVKKAKAEHDEKFASKEFVNEKIKVIDVQLTLIDKEMCADRATNLREHDSIKTEFVRQVEGVNQKIQILIDLINKKM
jgi:hypothetical protein